MFERLGSLTFRFRFLIVLAWIAGATWAVTLAPSLASEGMTDQTAFLPGYVESMQAHDALEAAFPGSTSVSSATLTFARDGGLTDADRAYIESTAAWITSADSPADLRERVTSVDTAGTRPELASMLRSDDGVLELVTVNLNVILAGGPADEVVAILRDHLASSVPGGLVAHVSGAAGIQRDFLAAITTGTERTTLVTVLLVVAILLLIYRAPLAALVPLLTIAAAFLVARGVLGVLAAAGWQVTSLLDTLLVVLIFGVGTDYAIFLISRFREEASRGDWHDASRVTVRRIGAVISASAATVMVGLGAMAFGDFGMIRTTGPALALAIFVMLIAGLTLTPALLGIFGRYLFWPRRSRAADGTERDGFFARLADAVSHRPGLVTVALLVVLVIPIGAVPRMKTNFDLLAELPANSDARAGFDQVAGHLGRGNVFQSTGIISGGHDADLVEPAALARLLAVMQQLQGTAGIASATSLVTPNGDGILPDAFRPSVQLADSADTFSAEGGGTAVDAESLLDPEVTDGLDTATAYLALLGDAFPDVAVGAEYRSVDSGLAEFRDEIDRVRASAVVSTQLRTLARAMTSPATAAGDAGDAASSIATIDAYLDELETAFPDVGRLGALADARAAAATLAREISIPAAIDLSGALDALAVDFDDRPDATLYPDSLSRTAEAVAMRHEIEATLDTLPVDLRALSAVFAARPDVIFLPVGLGGDLGADVTSAVDAFVSADRTATRLWIATIDDPYSAGGFEAIRRAQEILAGAAGDFGDGATAHLGGTTAQYADVRDVMGSDMQRVGIITVLGVLVVLMLLLRAIVAPIYLVGTVLLSFGTALGVSTWLFESVLGQPGTSFYLPILVFVLLVSLGSDYNIFLMSRVREESEGRPIRDGIRIASGRTGAVITSAGLILAGTFGSMATAPLVTLFQVGVAVAIGVLIDTFVVRSILVPAMTMRFGDRAWWPSGVTSGRTWPIVVDVPEPVAGAVVAAAPSGAILTPGASRRRLGVAVALLALVPMLGAGLVVWAMADPIGHLAGVTAAIVDLDTGATVADSDGTTRRLDLGADLAAQLASGTDPATFSWVATDATAASEGLADGRYGAVLTIPADFSATAAAIGRDDADASPATLRLETNDATSYTIGTIAASISAAIADSTAETVTAGYVDHVLLAVDAAAERAASAATSADALASGSTGLADGAAGVSATADTLVAGLDELAAGLSTAGDGVGELAAGVDGLADGADALADGAARLGDGAAAAAGGAGDLADGATTLADGLTALASGTADLPARVDALAAGANEVAGGASGVAAGARTLADSLTATAAGTAGIGDEAAALDAGAGALESGVRSLADGTRQTAAGAAGLESNAGQLSTATADYVAAVEALAGQCAALGGTDPLCSQLSTLAASGGELSDGASSLAAGAAELASGAGAAAAVADDLVAGADGVHAGTTQLAAALPGLEAGVGQAAAGASAVAGGATDLASGAGALATGTAAFSASVPALAGAVADASSGATRLADGAGSVAAGAAAVASGVDGLEAGARGAADGAARLATGTAAAAAGASQLATGMDDAAAGARIVASGVDGLATDGTAVADDAAALASGLQTDAATIPAYPPEDRAALGGLVARPVAVEQTRLNAVATSGSALAPASMAPALWVGALAIFLVVPALLGRPGRRRPWLRGAAGFLAGGAIAAVQAVAMVLLLRFIVGVEMARLPELLACSVLVGLAFVAINQALVALFDYRGWIVALVFAALQLAAAGLLFPVETAPVVVQWLSPLLPMTHAVEAFRALIAGGGPSLVPAVAALLAWLAGSLAVTLAVAAGTAGPTQAGRSSSEAPPRVAEPDATHPDRVAASTAGPGESRQPTVVSVR